MLDIFCIGSAHVDKILTFNQSPIMGNSNHAETKIYIGGVAYNIAAVLRALGNTVGISSILGDDGEGHSVVTALKRQGINSDALILSSDQHTASYNALHLPNGELLVAAADMHIYHKLTAELLLPCLPKLKQSKSWMVDSTFLPDMQELLAKHAAGIDVYVTICSVSEAKHIVPWLGSAKILFANAAEIAVLTDMPVTSTFEIEKALDFLGKQGAKTIMATNGADGVYVYNQGQHLHFPAYPASVVCVNGAGDSFAAGVIHDLAQGEELEVAVKSGLAAASLRLEGKPINTISIENITRAEEKKPALLFTV